MNMEQIPLGATGAQIPKIGFGTWKYRGGGGVLRRAVELQAGFVDTAEAYDTEERVAEDMAGIRDQIFVATKISPANLAYDDVLRHAEMSLRRLQTDVLDLYQVHWHNPDIAISETMRAMNVLVREGRVRFVGVSNFSVDQMRETQDALGDTPLASNQVKYNLLARYIEADVLPYCQEHDITVIAYSPLAKGDYAQQGLDVARGVADEAGKTVTQVMLNWLVAHPAVMAIPKTDQVDRVDEAVGAVGWSLTSEQRAALESGV
jgi:diketogulonate reductase-like aldo/keto reductase